ncbi:MAG: hypothetical protein HXX08_21715 [Chloroflexi bacterium]|uniref:Chorismate dehydratase n=1 Tax=Candidatus Chlorohelix allophototropha TaxID=3003348 RepID=A0A8T7M904_9CHLR|nr:hypothetical protein [Chloroflexota bacterium]WJW68416.1 hypothetical protein OZ401_004027 [Chloroflexota bacterium L227-S17]
MTIKLATTNDLDFAPFFFPIEAGWAIPPADLVEMVPGTAEDCMMRLLNGDVDVAPVDPALYALYQNELRILSALLYGSDMNSNNLFLLSKKRLDSFEKPRVAVSVRNHTGEILLKVLARPYYGFEPEFKPVASDLDALNLFSSPEVDMCVVGREVGMRAAGPANERGYFVEDMSKAWWLLIGQPLPSALFVVRRAFVEKEPDADKQVRQLTQFLRSSLQKSREFLSTVVEIEEKRTGLPAEGLTKHYSSQKYEYNAAFLNGLQEFYKRALRLRLISPVENFNFFPTIAQVAPAPESPPRRTVSEDKVKGNDSKKNDRSARSRAEERGITIIEGGKKPEKPDSKTD